MKWVVGPCCASLCRSDFGAATPFQRPAELAGRAEFTVEEAAVQEQINAAQFAEDLNTENLTPPNYNNFWFD